MASGGTDYYDKNTHEWYDTVMSIFDFETKEGLVRAYYQVLTTNSNQGYSETLHGRPGHAGDLGILGTRLGVPRAERPGRLGQVGQAWLRQRAQEGRS